jgi:hypothetical protein
VVSGSFVSVMEEDLRERAALISVAPSAVPSL